ncbi:imidazole glycerol phosphate synthase subunit HisH [Aneurinibacillus aneurinilyticus]|uniref:Imidazole glycerol phosphate synthase subunit HisH n=2 Tax=Aneurinibacillus aneurinilyticus TaxID=1391 RepID=A0A848D1M1_ANEAE|nr:imidazole glycerol phosphate synthase subunit HisH [Aneurinibacillus aneurinilyticus]ERI04489.1 imidazole glycerol phosphate synthase, glutamine amidotransferase subunit [Aneurinibacillus aneurinilyticus ATCC 12856]MED0706503.1 imidazole glycerol phosphate synthase subunit HisH [Aneurinibacillus aneurinilyticus]MED0721426.1 imidazole glycerol phosphate synthase subunit HisH [Aneurinibacillus aneurinilyticus]MED0731152.1 imidazole glycerol phosphate synthase subunit HisH [Aneurinibacillus ane
MIAIIDYGMGNLHSVSKAVERLGHEYTFVSDAQELMKAEGAILPGVGAFGDAMKNLREYGLIEAIRQFAASGKPLLGICLGMQILFDSSTEHGKGEGLGILPGNVDRFHGTYKIPHMGWNKLEFLQDNSIFNGVEEGYVYFVHSYFLQPTDESRAVLLATTDYYQEVPAVVGKNNVYGMQFHPEKSGTVGMKLLENFTSLCQTIRTK